jgi:hypothetical protein
MLASSLRTIITQLSTQREKSLASLPAAGAGLGLRLRLRLRLRTGFEPADCKREGFPCSRHSRRR